MPRIKQFTLDTAEGKTKELLEGVKKKAGKIPNILTHMATSPAALEGYLNFSGALANTSLSDKLREQIALTVAEINGCDYCAAAHSAVGKMKGLNQDELIDARKGTAPDSKDAAALEFTRAIVEKKGFVTDGDLEKVRDAGYSDGEIIEIVAVTSLNTYTNYINHVAETELDFPELPKLDTANA